MQQCRDNRSSLSTLPLIMAIYKYIIMFIVTGDFLIEVYAFIMVYIVIASTYSPEWYHITILNFRYYYILHYLVLYENRFFKLNVTKNVYINNIKQRKRSNDMTHD